MKLALNCTASARTAAAIVAAALAFGAAPAARAQAVSPLDFGTASLADVRLGVAVATIAELVDAPALLVRASSQAFVDDAFARIGASTNDPAVRAHLASDRDDLRPGDVSVFDRARADRDVVVLAHDLLRALSPPRDRLFEVGLLAEQSAYNARVLRSTSTDADVRRALGVSNVADTLVPGLAAMRAGLAALPAGHWNDVAKRSTDMVAAMLGPAVTPPFPDNGGVWLVLLRARPTTLGARRGTPRLFFDVVRFDGTHRTIGAYPSGSAGFSHDAAHLACGFDREGDAASERAVPIVPPAGTTDAQLGEELAQRCVASAKGSWRYRVRAASDARFIVDILANVLPNAAALLRETR